MISALQTDFDAIAIDNVLTKTNLVLNCLGWFGV